MYIVQFVSPLQVQDYLLRGFPVCLCYAVLAVNERLFGAEETPASQMLNIKHHTILLSKF